MFLLVYASSLTGINFEKTIWNNNLFLQIYSNALLLTKILSYTYKSLTIFLLFPTFSRIKTWRERERERERERKRERESWSQLIAMVLYLLPKVVKLFGQKVVERVLSAICTKHPNLFIYIYIYIYFTTLTLGNIEN